MSRPGPSVSSTGAALPGSDPYTTGLFAGGGGTLNVRPGSVGTVEIADGTVEPADLDLAAVAAALAARPEFTTVDGGTP